MSKILIDEAVVRQALEYIIATSEHDQLCDVLDLDEDGLHKPCSCLLQDVLDDLRAALAEQPEQEPVAWGNLAGWCFDSDRVLITDKDEAAKYHRDVYDLTPLYTSPPAPAGYAKKIESLIAERDALKAKLAEQPAQQEPDPDELTIAYMSGLHEGRKAEQKRVVNLLMIQHEAANGAHNYWKVAANLIQADVASDT